MSTTADVISDLETAFEAMSGTRTRMVSDYRVDLDEAPTSGVAYQLRLVPAGRDYQSSNTTRVVAALELAVARKLVALADEQTYTGGDMQTDLSSLTAASWWRALTAVRDVASIETKVERIGRVVVYTISATVIVA
jgi:hypothetical protein